MKVYERTENGVAGQVSIREGLDEVNHAMMDGKRDVKEMSSITRTDFAIEYKDGRKVTLVQVDAPAQDTPEPPPLTSMSSATTAARSTRPCRAWTNTPTRCAGAGVRTRTSRSSAPPRHRSRARRAWGTRRVVRSHLGEVTDHGAVPRDPPWRVSLHQPGAAWPVRLCQS